MELHEKSTVNTKMKFIMDLFPPVKNINTSLSEGPTTSNKSDNISNDNRKLKTYRSYIKSRSTETMFTKINKSDIETKVHCTNSPDSHSSSPNLPEDIEQDIPFTSKHSNDIQDIIENISSLTDSEKLSLLEHAWKPKLSKVMARFQ